MMKRRLSSWFTENYETKSNRQNYKMNDYTRNLNNRLDASIAKYCEVYT